MKIEKVTAMYFSPTGGTKTYVEKIAEGLSTEYEVINLANPECREKEYRFGTSDLVIFGAPVYAGRLPEMPGGIFERVYGENTCAVFTVSYGNREFEDALLEEKSICESNGFHGIAAGAFIAPHTYSEKIAAGRPDESDIIKTVEFVQQIKNLLKTDAEATATLKVPGNFPYRDGKKMPFYPEGDESCSGCGVCATVCPALAIPKENPTATDVSRCIVCMACVKNCPSGSRTVRNPLFQGLREKLEGNLLKVRKEPEIFMAE